MIEVFPVVPLIGNVPLGVAAVSYAGTFNIGITADRDAFPDVDVLAAGVRDAIQIARGCDARRPVSSRRRWFARMARTGWRQGRRRGGWKEQAMPRMSIRDVSLFVDVIGHGYPLVLLHGGPGADHWTLLPFRQIQDQFTLVFYDHRCNGRSEGADVSSMTWENLTADADALRQRLGFEKWAMLGHSFGGNVALEYALRYPDRLSHLILLDTGGDSRWSQENAPKVLAERGFDPKTVRLARRWLNGRIKPSEFLPDLMRLGSAYNPHTSLLQFAHGMIQGEWRSKVRPEALIFAAPNLLNGWTVMDRLHEIKAPTLVMAGRDDFVFPPACQVELAAGIPNSRLRIIERAGHNPHSEQTAAVMEAIRDFISVSHDVPSAAAAAAR